MGAGEDLENEYMACPSCAEAIKAEAILCRFCQSGLSPAHFRPCPSCYVMVRSEATLCRYCRSEFSEKRSSSSHHRFNPAIDKKSKPESLSPAEELLLMRSDDNPSQTPEALADQGLDPEIQALINGLAADDPVAMYLRDIDSLPLLTADQEIECAKKIQLRDAEAAKAQRKLVNHQSFGLGGQNAGQR